MTKRALLVARVSSEGQKDNYSPETQLSEMRDYAIRNGFTDIHEVKDVISGVVPIYDRQGGKEIHRAVNEKSYDAVIFYTFDRASREDDAIDFLTMRRDLMRVGIELHIIKEGGLLGHDEVSGLLAYLGVTRAGKERKAIRERTTRGRNAKARSGRAVGNGKAPYGYIYADGQLFTDENESKIAKLIYIWYAIGDDDGHKLSELGIARRLTEMGVPTPSESKGSKHKRKRPKGVWDTSSVHWILASETYCGVLRYGKAIGKGGKGGKRHMDDTIVIEVPAIVSQDIWKAAQAQRKFNNRIAKRRCKRDYLLRGLIKCGCGRSMSGTHGNYLCSRHSDYLAPCTEKIVKGAIVEQYAWEFALRVMTDEEWFESEWRKAQRAELEFQQPKRETLKTVESLLADCEVEAANLAAALKNAKGGIVAKTLQAQVETTNHRYDSLMTKRDNLKEELSTGTMFTEEALTNAVQFRQDVVVGLLNPTFEDKRNYMEWLQIGVTVKESKAVFHCLVPITDTIDLRTSKSSKKAVPLK